MAKAPNGIFMLRSSRDRERSLSRVGVEFRQVSCFRVVPVTSTVFRRSRSLDTRGTANDPNRKNYNMDFDFDMPPSRRCQISFTWTATAFCVNRTSIEHKEDRHVGIIHL